VQRIAFEVECMHTNESNFLAVVLCLQVTSFILGLWKIWLSRYE